MKVVARKGGRTVTWRGFYHRCEKMKWSPSLAPPMAAHRWRRIPRPSLTPDARSSVFHRFPRPWFSTVSFLLCWLAYLTPSVDCQGAVSISVGVGGRNSDTSGGSVPPPPATVAPVSQISQVRKLGGRGVDLGKECPSRAVEMSRFLGRN